MRKLTQDDVNDASSILDSYCDELRRYGTMDAWSFESDLRQRWNSGYRTFKALAVELSEIRQYRFLAAYYMEHIYPGGPAAEFKPVLAKLYGMRTYGSIAMTEKREAFWSGLQGKFQDDDC